MSHRRERAAILVSAIATLAGVSVVALAVARLALGTQETTWRLRGRLQADALLRSGVTLAATALEAHALTGEPDSLASPWAGRWRRSLAGGWVEVGIEDLARRLDLNAPELRPALARLAQRLGLPRTIVPSLADWIDPGDDARPDGAERAWYAHARPPLLPANGPLESLHHLRFVRDVTPDALARLAPYVTVGGGPALNPNTASALVLEAWLGDPVLVGRIVRARERGVVRCSGLRVCTLASRRFLVQARARVDRVERAIDAVLLVVPGLPPTVESWEPPLAGRSPGGDHRR